MLFDAYAPQKFYDEYFAAAGQPRAVVEPLLQWFREQPPEAALQAQAKAQQVLEELGATFTFDGEERVLPFDILPRMIAAPVWETLTAGLKQRVMALNQFCADIYGEQKIVKDGVIPREIVESAVGFLPGCMGMKPPKGIWCHISGTDLIRDREGQWHVLEDNLRVPSGIAYVLKNRQAMQRVLPGLLAQYEIEPVETYGQVLERTLRQLGDGAIAVLTPGPDESAYSEHAMLAKQTGAALVEPEALTLVDGCLQRQTPQGLKPIDIIYRRGDTQLINRISLDGYDSGLEGIIDLCQQGRLTLANAMGTGIADDKVIYACVPDMIRYYLDESPKLPNVPTYLCWRDSDRSYVLDHLDQLVVKSASEEGGKGMLVGPNASQSERADFAERIKQDPRGYMAQPTVYLSQIPTFIDDSPAGRHTDLRPYILHQGDDIHVHPGGLTRVALTEGSLVVNSTQGGGSKDTWILGS
ncbi:circularly permuted type 2 ATP-grasp protein [Romeria aff. gracilis LEGE 07310]|uniref:Circularly permuted type 2 ATP-grasp protein n=1 Tax=Vasconcelosia minhoensis LEGE 07310 TaxID=915328 RepID=A0A8J7DC64_9CYAN|nr:circularly permuted type 2 ATP-grasp protein [Romeria gracilis]MBE9078577.1 circularly permuted type 2 ATP-grasp protein [Romeria aff. gracilis LEGE 07310]